MLADNLGGSQEDPGVLVGSGHRAAVRLRNRLWREPFVT